MSLVTQKWPTCITYMAPLMEMDEPRHGCTQIASKTDFSQVMFCQDNLHHRLRESGAFEVHNHIGRERTTCTPVIEETVLQEFAISTQTSLRASERVLGVDRSTIMRILHEDMEHPSHFQKVQALCTDVYPKCIAFPRWYLQQPQLGRAARFSIVDFVF